MNDTTVDTCHVIGNWISDVVQVGLFVSAVLVLMLHWRQIEGYSFKLRNECFPIFRIRVERCRPWRVWFRDNFKQGLSATSAHVIGTLAAVELNRLTVSVNECDWYVIAFFFDTTEGCTLTIVFHRATAWMLSHCRRTRCLAEFGQYGGDEEGRGADNVVWILQCVHWLLCAIVARVIVFFTIVGAVHPLGVLANDIGRPLREHPNIKLLVNVVFVPLVLDTVQFLVQNIMLRARKTSTDGKKTTRASGGSTAGVTPGGGGEGGRRSIPGGSGVLTFEALLDSPRSDNESESLSLNSDEGDAYISMKSPRQ